MTKNTYNITKSIAHLNQDLNYTSVDDVVNDTTCEVFRHTMYKKIYDLITNLIKIVNQFKNPCLLIKNKLKKILTDIIFKMENIIFIKKNISVL